MNPMILSTFEEFFEKNPYLTEVCALDTETTGFGNDAKVIEVGAAGVKFDGVNIEFVEFSSFVNPHMPLPAKIIEITKITDDMLVNAPEDIDVFNNLDAWLKGMKLINMHNAKFDTRILRHNYHRVGKDFNQYEPIIRCTLEQSKAAKLPITSMKLGEVANHFGYKNEQAHRAYHDALATLYISARLTLGIH